MPTRNTGITAKLRIDASEAAAGAAQGKKALESYAASAEAVRKRSASEALRHAKAMQDIEARKSKTFGPQSREEWVGQQKAMRVERERHAQEMAHLERRAKMEQKIAENRERYASRAAKLAAEERAAARDTGMMHGPWLKQYDPANRKLSGVDWSHLEGREDVFRQRTATGNLTGGRKGVGGRGATNAGMGMLMLSQTLDDLQYGLKGVVNNIAPLIMSMGGSTGMAGAATIAAVAVNVLSNALNDEESRIKETNRQLKQYQEIQAIINRGVKEAAARGTATGNGAVNTLANSTRGRSEFDQMIDREKRVADLRKEAALAATDNLPELERARAQAAIKAEEEAKALAESRDLVERRLKLDRESAAAANEKVDATRAELEALRAQRDEAERERELEISKMEQELSLKKANRAQNSLKAGWDAARNTGRAMMGGTDVNPFKAEEAAIEARKQMGSNFPAGRQKRLVELEASMAGLEEAAGGYNQRIKEGENAVVDLNFAEAQLAQARAKERAEIEKLEAEINKAKLEKLQEGMKGIGDAATRAAGMAAEAWKAAGERAAKAASFREEAQGSLEVARLRARGKNKAADKLQADQSEAARVKYLMDGGMPAEEAKKFAKQERQFNEDAAYLSRTGHRKLRGATNAGSYNGLGDASQFTPGMAGEWNFDKLDAMKRDRRARPLKAEEAAAAAGGGNGIAGLPLQEVVPLLRTIRDLLSSSQPSAAEKLKPRNTNAG